MTEYVHLLARLVEKGQKVKKGQLIGRTGKSGKVTGPHLHFALIKGTTYLNSKRVDPHAYLLSVSAPKSPQTVVKVVPSATPTVKTPVATPQPLGTSISGGASTAIPPSDTSADTETVKIEPKVVIELESTRFTLDTKDAKSIAVGALLAVGGSLLVYFSDVLTQIDWGKWAYIAIPLTSILINALRKFLEGKEK